MLSMKDKRKCRKSIEDCDGNYGELLKLIEAETQHMQDMLMTHRQTDILRNFKSNISFERSYELSMYIVELASKEIQRSARRSQSRNAKDYIDYIMSYKA